MSDFLPDYRNIVAAARNRAAPRLPLYEHIIAPVKMEEITGQRFAGLLEGDASDQREFFRHYCAFFKNMGYDTVSFECCACNVVAQGEALSGHTPGAITDRKSFETYPFDTLAKRYWEKHESHFRLLGEELPDGMKAIGGIGNGLFELAQDFAGFTGLCMMRADDPELYAELFRKVGDFMLELWEGLLARHGDTFAVGRFGDDLGFKSATLLPPDDIRTHILPEYKRIVARVHQAGKPFLFHSCGCILDIFDDVISTVGIDAKHSNEDQIAPFQTWVDRYGDRIGNFGGVDLNVLCLEDEQTIRAYVRDVICKSEGHGGIALGSGNSIPDYVPAAGYLAMVNAVREYRGV